MLLPLPKSIYLTALKKKCSSRLSGQPSSQSAPCILILSSGLDIEEGFTAPLLLLLPLLLSLPLCVGFVRADA